MMLVHDIMAGVTVTAFTTAALILVVLAIQSYRR